VINSSLVLARYLQQHRPGARVFPIGELPLIDELARHGFEICQDPERIDVVVVSWDRDFTYHKLDVAYRAALRGADLVATNPDRTCPMPGYRLPDAACMIAAVEACTRRKVEPIVGKPSAIMLRQVLRVMQLRAEQCVMIGDRPETDMAMARRAGLTGILTLTGVTEPAQARALETPPEAVVESVAQLLHDL
jgi:HAD superfamily hydrolase (TIGR01450 family)